ncbi:MAG: HD domain-containing protein [Caldilineaceae bacterium]|nr:HD domain-containing protein [Caldilineaceae bacterium]
MSQERLVQQIRFIEELDKLKRVLRRTSLIGNDRRENSAEHSWHIAVIAMVLAEYSNAPIDLLHVLRMVLVHDIVEIDAGDTFAYDTQGYTDKEARERAAAQRIFGLLPADQGAEFQALWEEFEARRTPAARFANAVDRLMPALQNYHNGGGTWHAAGVDRAMIDDRLRPIGDASIELWTYVRGLIDETMANGLTGST